MASESRAIRPTLPAAVVSSPDWCPGRDEAWWWAGIPVLCAVLILGIYAAEPDFYNQHILPEGYGVLELSHFFVPLTGFLICLRLFKFPLVRSRSLLCGAIIVFALTTLYIAGEEHSWGQHFLHWNTPDYWGDINRQEETNLHNVSPWFNNRPRLVLEIAIALGGLVIPLVQMVTGPFASPLLALLTPAAVMIPTTLIYVLFKIVDHLNKHGIVTNLLSRPNEAIETFIYLFILYYLIVLYRRIRALDAAGVSRIEL